MKQDPFARHLAIGLTAPARAEKLVKRRGGQLGGGIFSRRPQGDSAGALFMSNNPMVSSNTFMSSNPGNSSHTVARWHQVAQARDVRGLETLLADEAVFLSPVVFTPQVGKAITTKYLAAAFQVF